MQEPGTVQQKLGFAEKVQIFSEEFLKCCIYICETESARETFTKRLYAKMVSSSKLLEDFLDNVGAKNNSNWYYYRELVSSVRNLSLASYSQKHISNRLPFYDLPNTKGFEEGGYTTHRFLITSLRRISQNALAEARRLHIQVPDDRFVWDDFPGTATETPLEFDIDDENLEEEKKNIVKITTEFLRVAKEFETLGFYEPYTLDQIKAIVPSSFNEQEARRFEMVVHSLQSSFDTYVNRSGLRFRNIKLKRLRGYISVVLHLLELTRCLLHYYERHLYEVGYKNIYKRVCDELAKAVWPEHILDRIMNYGLYYIWYFLVQGQDLAHELLNENMEQGSIVVGIPQNLGFHSRPSMLVAKIVQHYGGQVELCVDSDRFDASSVLDIQWAGGKVQKENIKQVVFQGDVRALRDIQILANVNYGEDSMGKGIPLPKELSYLKQ
ncbi:MAG: HPr family phosphocarrier protein [Deltaproteobacteria bacterium]|nr:HPr family phosphocarrier protein [Deltaproteobacteria bacterium]MBW2018422.1 HPr family phosphocarrier protein [Deltaproteobacteria bacterium]MBW2073709.1 HPr family phosphocarrier protein [Deltaproteobacteria bacterium]RLB83584.1 MAG: HPr family phosphocarrier protein [Deltaproteobacteria bacterium]